MPPKKLIVAGLISCCLLLPNLAYAGKQCGGPGYVKSVVQNHWAFRDSNIIGITVLHDDGVMRNYYSFQNSDAGNHAGTRTLLQLATSAFLSQARVYVTVAQECSYTYKEADGRTWVTRWNGLWLENK